MLRKPWNPGKFTKNEEVVIAAEELGHPGVAVNAALNEEYVFMVTVTEKEMSQTQSKSILSWL